MGELVKKDDAPITTIVDDVVSELAENLFLINDVIETLAKDTRVIKDEIGDRIVRDTHIHPQLLSWVKEKRMLATDMWKIAGGELQHEKEKEKIKIQGKMILETLGTMSPDELEKKREEWKEQYDNSRRST